MSRGWLFRVVMVVLIGACARAPTPPLSIRNGTDLTVLLLVNGTLIATFPPGTGADPVEVALPPVPWHVEARTAISGRVLVEFDVREGTVTATTFSDGHGAMRGAGARADLSCGRLDVWSGPPMGGPVPPRVFPPDDCRP